MKGMKNNFIQIFTTTGTKKEAQKIADVLVKNKLAGCVQIIGPIESHYVWKEKREQTNEFLCIIKTKTHLYSEVEKAIKKVHSYELPEIVAVPIVNGSKDYLKWIHTII